MTESRRIKVAMLAPYPATGVVPREMMRSKYYGREHAAPWIFPLCQALAKREELEFVVIALTRSVKYQVVSDTQGFTVIFVPQRLPARFNSWHLFYLNKLMLQKEVRKFGPDIIHAFGVETGYASIASYFSGCKTAFIQGIAEKLYPWNTYRGIVERQLLVLLERRALSEMDGLIAETEFAANWSAERFVDVPVKTIPHVYTPASLETKLPAFTGMQFLVVGAITRVKAVDTIIRALAVVDGPATLRILGAGSEEPACRSLARDLGVADRVYFDGYCSREKVMETMRYSRALIIASRMDTSPNVITEAHVAGLPVIGTEAGGIPDMIIHGEDGFLVAVDDYKNMAGHMNLLCSDTDLCQKMGQAGRKKVLQLNSPDRVAEKHISFFYEVWNEWGSKRVNN